MNALKKFIISIFIILVLVYYLTITKEGWVPWVWNMPTRDIYPRLYYDMRCAPPITHYYRDTPYLSNYPYFNQASFPVTGIYYPNYPGMSYPYLPKCHY
jgi:hypothetical protein